MFKSGVLHRSRTRSGTPEHHQSVAGGESDLVRFDSLCIK
jgi:hypothetical protein